VANKLNIQKPEDWLHVPQKIISKEEGSSFITHYYGSVIKGTSEYYSAIV
jgi:hypothetical protein